MDRVILSFGIIVAIAGIIFHFVAKGQRTPPIVSPVNPVEWRFYCTQTVPNEYSCTDGIYYCVNRKNEIQDPDKCLREQEKY